jgi:SAM-dependent methyltransferase
MNTSQMLHWIGQFGAEYTDRNSLTLAELDGLYRRNYGFSRAELNRRFLSGVPRDARVLEVGCNIGLQLGMLRELEFSNLYGIEIQHYAVKQAKSRIAGVRVVEASALEIPFPDQSLIWCSLPGCSSTSLRTICARSYTRFIAAAKHSSGGLSITP